VAISTIEWEIASLSLAMTALWKMSERLPEHEENILTHLYNFR